MILSIIILRQTFTRFAEGYSNERESLNSNYFLPVDSASVDGLLVGVVKRAAEVTVKDVCPTVVTKKDHHMFRLNF